MELILHKPRGLCNSKMQRDREEDKTLMKKNVLSSQKVSYCRPKNRERDGLGTFIFPCNRIRGWSQNTWKLYPEKQCETWPSGIWEIQTAKGGTAELQSFKDGDNFNMMQTSVHVLWIEIIKHLHSHVRVHGCRFLCSNEFSGTGVHELGVEFFVCCRCLHLQNVGAALNVCSHKQMCNMFPLVSVQIWQKYHFNCFMSHSPLVWSRIRKLASERELHGN